MLLPKEIIIFFFFFSTVLCVRNPNSPTFECVNGRYIAHKVCDGYDDCEDGSDETLCVKSKKYGTAFNTWDVYRKVISRMSLLEPSIQSLMVDNILEAMRNATIAIYSDSDIYFRDLKISQEDMMAVVDQYITRNTINAQNNQTKELAVDTHIGIIQLLVPKLGLTNDSLSLTEKQFFTLMDLITPFTNPYIEKDVSNVQVSEDEDNTDNKNMAKNDESSSMSSTTEEPSKNIQLIDHLVNTVFEKLRETKVTFHFMGNWGTVELGIK